MSEQNTNDDTNSSERNSKKKITIAIVVIAALIILIIAVVLIISNKSDNNINDNSEYSMKEIWDTDCDYKWSSLVDVRGNNATSEKDAYAIIIYIYPDDEDYIAFNQEEGKTVPTKNDGSIDTKKYNGIATNAKENLKIINNKFGFYDSIYDAIINATDSSKFEEGDIGASELSDVTVEWAGKTDSAGKQRIEVTYSKS